jgi:hypothetical protein
MVVVLGARVVGPLEPFADGFAGELARQGYTVQTRRQQLGLVAHLSRWMTEHHLQAAELSPEVVDTGSPITTTDSTVIDPSVYERAAQQRSTLKCHHDTSLTTPVTTEGLSLTVAMERLLAIEVDANATRRLAGRLRFASLPTAGSSINWPPAATWSRPPTSCWWARSGLVNTALSFYQGVSNSRC